MKKQEIAVVILSVIAGLAIVLMLFNPLLANAH